MKKPKCLSGRLLWVVFLFCGVILPCNARGATRDTLFVAKPLDTVVVQGRRTGVGNRAYQMIATIERVDIENLAVRTVDDVLRFLPGVDVRSRGANGGQTDVSIRGGTFDQVMIMINGVCVNDLQTGHYSMNLPVDIALIERIEVLQGGGAGMFGGNALTGAINIITRRDKESWDGKNHSLLKRNDEYRGKVAAGMYGYVAPSFAGRNDREKYDIAYSGNFSRSDGYKAPGTSAIEDKALRNSDYRMANLWFQSSFHGVDLQFGAQYKDIGAGMFYGFGSQDQFDATRTAFGSARYAGRWNGWSLEAQLSYRANYDRYEWHRGERKYGNFHFSQDAAASVKGGYSYRVGKTAAGIEVRNHNIHSTNLGDTVNPDGQVPNVEGFPLGEVRVLDLVRGANRLDISWFVSQMFHYGDFTANLSVNGLWDKTFGSNLGGGVNLGYEFMQASSLYLNVGRTYRMPSFTDLYYDAGNQLGNRCLKAEKAWTVALGANLVRDFGDKGKLSGDISAYYRLGQDIIDWVFVAGDPRRPFHAANLEKVHTAGAELSIAYRWNFWLKNVGFSYAYTYMDLGDYAECSRYLDYLSHKAILRFEHGIARLRNSEFGASWTLTYRKREGNFNDADGIVRGYGDVLLLDGEVYWKNRFMKVSAECENITNARYYDYGGVLRPGAWFVAGISFVL